jgi:hypothetical protein
VIKLQESFQNEPSGGVVDSEWQNIINAIAAAGLQQQSIIVLVNLLKHFEASTPKIQRSICPG